MTGATRGLRLGVVVPVYNRRGIVVETLESIRRQTVPPWRVVVVDDGSRDGSADAVEAWLAEHPMPCEARVVRQENGGVSRARNRGAAEAAEADLLVFLDSDDLWPEDFVASALEAFAADPGLSLASADSVQRVCHADGRASAERPRPWRPAPGRVVRQVASGSFPGTPATVVRAPLFFALGGFPEGVQLGEDAVFFLVAAASAAWGRIASGPVVFRQFSGSAGGTVHLSAASSPEALLAFAAALEARAGAHGVSRALRFAVVHRWCRAAKGMADAGRFAEARECYGRALAREPWNLKARWRRWRLLGRGPSVPSAAGAACAPCPFPVRESSSAAPRVSVVLPAYNAAPYVEEAVRSVLAQTLPDIELIVVDDGSGDATGDILRRLAGQDARLRVVSRGNRGLVASLNEGIALARAPLVARMDADDVSLPDRLLKQVRFMDAHPEVVLAGAWFECMDPDGVVFRHAKTPVASADIKERLFRGHQTVGHPTWMMRTDAARGTGYRTEAFPAEDLDFLQRIAGVGELACVPEILLRYRVHPQSISRQKQAQQREAAAHLTREARARHGLPPLPAEEPPATGRRAQSAGSPARDMAKGAVRHGYPVAARKWAKVALLEKPWHPDRWWWAFRSVVTLPHR